jgi:hypothetical protein
MEGERDDIQFYFGKAFRTLKRTERDMTRQITDKVKNMNDQMMIATDKNHSFPRTSTTVSPATH